MSFFNRTKYKDEQIVATAERAMSADPLLTNPTAVGVSSRSGVILLTGNVHSDRVKRHVEDTVQRSLQAAGLKFDRIHNKIDVG